MAELRAQRGLGSDGSLKQSQQTGACELCGSKKDGDAAVWQSTERAFDIMAVSVETDRGYALACQGWVFGFSCAAICVQLVAQL